MRTFHFEVDLNGIVVPVRTSHFIPFPIAAWSTKGWREPTGQLGNFNSPATRFPPWPERQFFTVGCYLDVMLQYVRGTLEMAPYPQNIQVKLARTAGANSRSRLMRHSPGGRRASWFSKIAPGDKIEVRGYVGADAIATGRRISPVSGTMTINNTLQRTFRASASGLSAFPRSATSSCTTSRIFPSIRFGAFVKKPEPRLHYDAYDSMVNNYGSIPADDKLASASTGSSSSWPIAICTSAR